MQVGQTGIVELGPTAYEEAVAKEARLTPRQRQAPARRLLKKMERSYWGTYQQWTTGGQYAYLCGMRTLCQDSGIEAPEWVLGLIEVHDRARAKAGLPPSP